jgi:glycosyltransferase involved in cell wall biosynthesis
VKIFLNLLAATAGGQLSRARAFLDRFDAFSKNAELVVVKEKTALVEYTSTDKRVIIDVPIGHGRLKVMRRLWWENFIMPSVIHKHKADVYLTFSHYLPHLKDVGVPSVVGVSNLAPFSSEAWAHESLSVKLKMLALRKTIVSSTQRATSVLALSETCRDVLIDQGVSRDKIIVTPNGVDVFWGQPAATTDLLTRLDISRPFLLYVSHFHRYKNYIRLIESYAQLPISSRSGYQLVLVGKPQNKSCYAGVKEAIKQHNISDDVVLIPGESSENLKELYQNASLFVFPSLIENSPNILLEAMMAGAPVASSSLPPMPEFCGTAAEYFDALDVSSMTSKIENLLNDSKRLLDLSKSSRSQACKFSWDAFVSNVMENIEIVVDNFKRDNKC